MVPIVKTMALMLSKSHRVSKPTEQPSPRGNGRRAECCLPCLLAIQEFRLVLRSLCFVCFCGSGLQVQVLRLCRQSFVFLGVLLFAPALNLIDLCTRGMG